MVGGKDYRCILGHIAFLQGGLQSTEPFINIRHIAIVGSTRIDDFLVANRYRIQRDDLFKTPVVSILLVGGWAAYCRQCNINIVIEIPEALARGIGIVWVDKTGYQA